MGAGGTKKEAKRQAAGTVLEDITSPVEKNNYTKQQDVEETNVTVNELEQVEKDKNHQPNEDREIIDTSNELNSSENKEEDKLVFTNKKFDEDVLNQKLDKLN